MNTTVNIKWKRHPALRMETNIIIGETAAAILC